jgi:hypothetical protein
LVNRGGAFLRIRIHFNFFLMSIRCLVAGAATMLRPSRSGMVTEIDIGAALPACNLIKTKSSPEQILGIFRSCPLESTCWRANARGVAKVAGARPFLDECCRSLLRF